MIEARGADTVTEVAKGEIQNPEIPVAEGENICGLLVHAKPSRLTTVSAALNALPGVEIEHTTDEGRMVVIVEDVEGIWAGDTITKISNIEGVLSSALVYHQNAENMNEAISEVVNVAAKGEEISR